jgi:23S rRNA pseudouridine2604 synthase
LEDGDDETKETLSMGTALHFSRKKWNGFDLESSTIPRHIRKNIAGVDDKKSKSDKWFDEATLSGYATAGRLDIDSTGVIIFTRAGIMARRLIAPDTKIPKEYIVKVQPAVQPTTREKEAGLLSLPSPTRNLTSLLRGGKRLWNDKKALKPVLEAEWLEENSVLSNGGTLRLVLQEGKKRQIRRMCREILGMHVVSLVRKSIGPIQLDTLPEGKWRPLKEQEVREIFADTPHKKRKKAKRFVGKD